MRAVVCAMCGPSHWSGRVAVPRPVRPAERAGWWEATTGGHTRAVMGDLNMAWTIYRTPGVNAEVPRVMYEIDETTLRVIREIRLDGSGNLGPKSDRKGGAGNEYITLTRAIALAALFMGAVLALIAYKEILFYRAMRAFDAVEVIYK